MATELKGITPAGWKRGGGYQHAMVVENCSRIAYISGQIEGSGGRPAAAFSKDMASQFASALANFKTVVEATGGTVRDITSMTIYVTDGESYRANQKAIGESWRRELGDVYPAVTLVGVTELFNVGAKVEIEGTVALG